MRSFLKKRRWLLFVLCFSASLSSPALRAQTNEGQTKLHTFADIKELMEKSDLNYLINTLESGELAQESKPIVLSSQLYLKQTAGGYSVSSYQLQPEGEELLKKAENSFASKDYNSAIKIYKELYRRAPDYFRALTLIGDAYYSLKEYEEAKVWFKKAIEKNFIDYNAHWFLSDAEWAVGNDDEALRELTVAHLLNVNHQTVKKRLVSCRQALNKPWQDWDYVPRYRLKKVGDTISIDADLEWLAYACVKAVWEYEPGYAEKMSGPDHNKRIVDFQEEKEALANSLAANEGKSLSWKQIDKIGKDGFVNEFILYEILGRKAPSALILLPREQFLRLVEYINTYH